MKESWDSEEHGPDRPREVGDAGEMDARRLGHLCEVHRAERLTHPTPETQPLCESGRAPSEALLSLTVELLNWPRCKPVAFSPNSEVMGMKNMSRAADEPPSPALWAPSPTRRGNKKIRLTLPSPFGRGAGGEGLKPMREYISIQFRISDLAKATCHWFKAVSIL
ncbi:MAG: hypothetical protein DMG05_28260 [Acidobacteria bacterium]|nr:MAG: hypothetical protein DMG05_28260 [Acidobacteriota bacterium]